MRLTDKYFPRHGKFHKLFNRYNVKLSYSCMPSMKNVIQKHNSKIMEDPKPTNNKTCSCRQKLHCLLNHYCLSECLVYNAVVETSTTKNYYETCERVSKRDITITRHHLETNHVRKVQSFLTTYGN